MKLIGNTDNIIDWDSVILQCSQKTGNTIRYNKAYFPDTEDFNKLNLLWQEAGYMYDDSSIEWTNFFPGTDFNQSVVESFENIVNAKPWMVWISCIDPGRMAPWHIDAHSKIDELLSLGNPIRFTCYIQPPTMAQVSIVEDKCIYLPAKGSIYQWPSYDAWHCGMNGGLSKKYMFNYWGYRN